MCLRQMNTLKRELATEGRAWLLGRATPVCAGSGKILPKLMSVPYGLAIIYARLGEKPKAFENLENALAERDTQITELAIEPQFDALRSDASLC